MSSGCFISGLGMERFALEVCGKSIVNEITMRTYKGFVTDISGDLGFVGI